MRESKKGKSETIMFEFKANAKYRNSSDYFDIYSPNQTDFSYILGNSKNEVKAVRSWNNGILLQSGCRSKVCFTMLKADIKENLISLTKILRPISVPLGSYSFVLTNNSTIEDRFNNKKGCSNCNTFTYMNYVTPLSVNSERFAFDHWKRIDGSRSDSSYDYSMVTKLVEKAFEVFSDDNPNLPRKL